MSVLRLSESLFLVDLTRDELLLTCYIHQSASSTAIGMGEGISHMRSI